MFDILAFTERDEYYRVFPGEGGRLALTAIDPDAADSKLGKIVGKQYVTGGDVQLTLHDGETLLVEDDDEYTLNDRSSSATRTARSSPTSPTGRARSSRPSTAHTPARSDR